MGTTTNKLSYLTETKEKIAEKIIDLGGNITNQTTFRQYANELKTLYDNADKVSAEGSNIILENCAKGKMIIQPKGNTELLLPDEYQQGEDYQTKKNVTGNNKVKIISGKNLLSNNFEDYTIGSLYGYYKIIDNIGSHNLVMSLIDEDTSIDMSGIYFGLSRNGTDASGGVSWIMANGNENTKKIINNSFKYFSFFPDSPATFNKIFSRYKIQVEIRNDVNQTDYEPYIEPIEKELNLTGYTLMKDDYITEDCVIHHQGTTESIPEDTTLYNQVKDLYRTIIQVPTIIIETESDVDNAQLIVNASALKSS